MLEVCLPIGSLDANLDLACRAAVAPAEAEPVRACRGGRAAWRAPSKTVIERRDAAENDRARTVGGLLVSTEDCALAEEAWGHRRYRGAPDTEFVMALLSEIERAGIPAPAPIEQRWTARSTAPMSPAASAWVSLFYLPPLLHILCESC